MANGGSNDHTSAKTIIFQIEARKLDSRSDNIHTTQCITGPRRLTNSTIGKRNNWDRTLNLVYHTN